MPQVNCNELVNLIDRIPEIKKEFREEHYFISRAVGKPTTPLRIMTIRKSLSFKTWRADLEYQLRLLPRNQYIEEIFKQFSVLDAGYAEETAFDSIETRLLTIKAHINDFQPVQRGESYGVYSEEIMCNYILKALINIQKNPIYKGKLEDEINDGIRDNLSMIYSVHDQTRQGESESGMSAGEVDLLISDGNGLPYALVEALRLPSLDKDNLDKHIDKALVKYDPVGCPYIFVFTYATGENFVSFWDKFYNYLCEYDFPYEVESAVTEVEHGYAESRHAKVVLNRNNHFISVHFYVIHVRG